MSSSPDAPHREEMSRMLARYEFGALEGEEQPRFENHLLECDTCFAELERGSLVVAELRDHARKYAQILREEPAPLPAPQVERRESLVLRVRRFLEPARRPWALVPAALAAAALGFFVLRFVLGPPDLRDLATFPREELATAIVRGPGMQDAVSELMESGAAYFDQGRYDEAERRFQAALEREPDLAEAAYLLGLSRALSGEVEGAIPAFERAVRLAEGGLEGKARWALANAYLKAGRTREAQTVLLELRSGDGEYAARALDLLARLDR